METGDPRVPERRRTSTFRALWRPFAVLTIALVFGGVGLGIALSQPGPDRSPESQKMQRGHSGGTNEHRRVAAPSFPPSPQALTELRAIALRASSANNDAQPSSAQVWLSTRQAAVDATTGSLVDTDQPVYVLEVHGHFVATLMPVPPGHPPPKGDVLTLVLDASTLETTDISVGDRGPVGDFGPAATVLG
jgi:hypothetical protein